MEQLLRTENQVLEPHHYVRLTQETKLDLELWRYFLHHPTAYCRPFMDFNRIWSAEEIPFFTDAAKSEVQSGIGGWCESEWFSAECDPLFFQLNNPSIAYLELFVVTVGVKLWLSKFMNRRIIIRCDNQAVVTMINNSTSSCKNCMVLIRIIVLECMVQNMKLHCIYINLLQMTLLTHCLDLICIDSDH